jgi:hypothetical protein
MMQGSKWNQVKPLQQSNTSDRWSSPSPGIAIAALGGRFTPGRYECDRKFLRATGDWVLLDPPRLHLLNYVDSPEYQRNIQRALNRGESHHKLARAVAYANGGKLRVRTDQEQQLWSECSRLLANCIIYYNVCILSELLERAERWQDYQWADAIKRANPASWKHANLYGAYSFLDIGDGVDLQELVNLLEAAVARATRRRD